jgi:thiamine biosynthesis lipoprotein
MKRTTSRLIAAFIVSVSVLLCCKHTPVLFRTNFWEMDTYIEVKLYADDEHEADRVFRVLKNEAVRLQHLLSAYDSSSEIFRINHRNTTDSSLHIDHEVGLIIERASSIAQKTDGKFDPTIGPVKWLWGFGSTLKNRVPSHDEIAKALSCMGTDQYTLDSTLQRITFHNRCTKIDLGGISKGYALQRFTKIMKKNGLSDFLIIAGGDIAGSGSKTDSVPWKIGIKHPRDNSQLLAALPLSGSECIVTSGDYERFFMPDSTRFHHIFDPSTGYPARGCISATVVAQDAVAADVYSTAVFVMGARNGIEWINTHNEIEGVLVEENDTGLAVYISDGLVDRIEMLTDNGTIQKATSKQR